LKNAKYIPPKIIAHTNSLSIKLVISIWGLILTIGVFYQLFA
jgi:hypothetical protein